MISDMSPGDKLSLKGKLFELSKKLSIIDFESKRENQYSFKPEILPYDLPERDENMVNSLRKAEIIRKQRKELLQQSVITNSLEGCTFSPQFVSNSRNRPSVKNDTRPAHERLTQKGKEYREKKINMQATLKKGYDFDGNKLFTPHLNERLPGGAWTHGSGRGTGNGPPSNDLPGDVALDSSLYHSAGSKAARLNTSSSSSGHPYQQPKSSSPKGNNSAAGKCVNTMSADEFLYQDAKDREERHRMRSLDAVVEAEAYASTVKTNKRSYDVLRKKAERELEMVFKYLVGCDKSKGSSGGAAGAMAECLSLDCVKGGSLLLVRSGLQQKNVTATVFQLLNFRETGSVSWSDFFSICLPLVFHQKMNAALVDIKQTFSLLSSSFSGSANGGASEGFTASMEDLQTLKDWLSHLITALSPTPTHSVVESEPHQPKPNKISHKLAARKAEKDKQQFKEIVKATTDESLLLSVPLNLDESVGGSTTEGNKNSKVSEYNELLSIREKLAIERRKQLEEQVLAERMTECTFKPQMPKAVARRTAKNNTSATDLNKSSVSLSTEMQNLLDNSDLSSSSGAVNTGEEPVQAVDSSAPPQQRSKNVFAKLYNQKVAHQTAAADTSSHIIEELKYCTFQPHLAPRKPLVVSSKPIEGFDKSVSRIRTVHQEKVKAKEAEAVQYIEDDLRYKKSRLVAQQGIKPFHFTLEDRRKASQQQQMEVDNAPKLIIEVKLSANKTAKISIGASDVPEQLAARFARIYALEPAMTGVFTEVIRQSMLQNGLISPDDERARGPHDAEGGTADDSYESGVSEGEGRGSADGDGDEADSTENSEDEDTSGGEDSEYDEESLRDAEEELVDVEMVDAAAQAQQDHHDPTSVLELSAQSNDSQDDNDQLEMLLMTAHSGINGGVSSGGGLSRSGSLRTTSPSYTNSLFSNNY